jgi:prophage regulatory protein
MDKLLLTPKEVAEQLGLGRTKTYALLASGEIPSVRIGGSLRVPLSDLRDWVRTRACGSKSDSDE